MTKRRRKYGLIWIYPQTEGLLSHYLFVGDREARGVGSGVHHDKMERWKGCGVRKRGGGGRERESGRTERENIKSRRALPTSNVVMWTHPRGNLIYHPPCSSSLAFTFPCIFSPSIYLFSADVNFLHPVLLLLPLFLLVMFLLLLLHLLLKFPLLASSLIAPSILTSLLVSFLLNSSPFAHSLLSLLFLKLPPQLLYVPSHFPSRLFASSLMVYSFPFLHQGSCRRDGARVEASHQPSLFAAAGRCSVVSRW